MMLAERCLACWMLVGLLATGAAGDEALRFVEPPRVTRDSIGKSGSVRFAISQTSDVEVAIVDVESGQVVRHLAAGVLGDDPPPPLIARTLTQKIAWDGRDDQRQPVEDWSRLAVRVRAGMRVALRQIVGGDPFAYHSGEMPHGDHSPWGINGLERKPDGRVFVLGHSSSLGPPAVREFDGNGNYQRTVFPPAAGLPIAGVRGWGINTKEDGTYTPRFQRLTDPSVSTTILDTHTGGMARLLPTPDPARLSFWHTGFGGASFELLTINRNGTVPRKELGLTGRLVADPPLPIGLVSRDSHVRRELIGPVFTCLAADGKHFFLSGVCEATTLYGTVRSFQTEGFWRDGQVWKVDFATRTARPFFALEAAVVANADRGRGSAIGGQYSYAALHGAATDADGRVFVCDRLNRRIVVLDDQARVLRELPVEHADAIAVSARTGALYVTTRLGDEGTGPGEVWLLKFNDWRTSDQPAIQLRLSRTGFTSHHKHSYVLLCESENATNVWVAYTEMPVRVYRDDASGFKLLRDFHDPTVQRCLGFDRIDVDAQTEDVFVLDDHAGVWKIDRWDQPRITKIPLRTPSIAVDSKRRHIYIRTLADGGSSYAIGKVARHLLDDPDFAPAHFGDTGNHRITPSFQHQWCFTGNGDKGFAVAPNGNVALMGDPGDGLRLFHGDERQLPWTAARLAELPDLAGGIRFDLHGNLYVGFVNGPPTNTPAGFKDDPFAARMGRIFKFAPSGSLDSGNLFPTRPSGPAKTYDVRLGAYDLDCLARTPRFAVDGFSRIYYPTNIEQCVTVIDNSGNTILAFGTYGNRDSLGGLPGDLVSTRDIPLAFPNSVAATDRFIYVGDMVNHRLLRIEKQFALSATTRFQ